MGKCKCLFRRAGTYGCRRTLPTGAARRLDEKGGHEHAASTGGPPANAARRHPFKSAWMFHADADRRYWRGRWPALPRSHHQPPRARPARRAASLLAAAKNRPPGPTIFRSTDLGQTWRKRECCPPSARRRTASTRAASTTRSGWRRRTPASRMSGMPAPRRRACSAPLTTAATGHRSSASTTIRSIASGSARCRTARRTALLHSIIVDQSAIRSISISRCPAAACMSPRWRRQLRAAGRRHGSRRRFRRPERRLPRPALRPPLPRQSRSSLPAEPFAASIGSIARAGAGEAHRPQHAGRGGRHRLLMVVHPRDDRTLWVFPMDGSGCLAARQPGGGPPPTSAAMAAKAGSA